MIEKKKFAYARLIAALVLAAALLGITGFAFADLLAGPAVVTGTGELEENAYIETELAFIMDVVGVEKTSGGKEVAYYAVAPVGSSFTILRFPAEDLENVNTLEKATDQYLQGETAVMDIYMTVTGTVAAPKQAETELLLTWFEDNEAWMTASGVIASLEDYSAYIGTHVIRVGTVGTMSTGLVVAATVVALLLAVYAIVEAILLGAGVYNKKPAPKAKKEKKAPVPVPVADMPKAEEPCAEEMVPAAAPVTEDAPAEEEAEEEVFVDESFLEEKETGEEADA